MTEDYLQTTLKSVLKWFPEKLKTSVDGRQVEKSVDFDLILKSATIDEVVDAMVRKQLLSIFYGSPERYFEYIESVLSIKIEAGLKDSFVEVKATRDIIVHNAGIANDTYAEKAGTKARAKPGDQLKNDEVYFGESIRCMKSLTQTVYSKSVAKFTGKPRRRVKHQA